MPLPRVRFTVRRMMIAVAIVAVYIAAARGLIRRSSHRLMMAEYHRERQAVSITYENGALVYRDDLGAIVSWQRHLRHADMASKYRIAADDPVTPDPPDPN